MFKSLGRTQANTDSQSEQQQAGDAANFFTAMVSAINAQSVLPCGRRHSPHLRDSSQRKPTFRKTTPHATSMVLFGRHRSILAALG